MMCALGAAAAEAYACYTESNTTLTFYYDNQRSSREGTTYDASHVDKAYAHIDGGPSNPGYFTAVVQYLRGDVNGDFQVSIADVSALIDLLLGGSTISNPAADVNLDSNVSIADVSALIDLLLGGN